MVTKRRKKVTKKFVVFCNRLDFFPVLTSVSVSDFLPALVPSPLTPLFPPMAVGGGGPAALITSTDSHLEELAAFPLCLQPVVLWTAVFRFGSSVSGSGPCALVHAGRLCFFLPVAQTGAHLGVVASVCSKS